MKYFSTRTGIAAATLLLGTATTAFGQAPLEMSWNTINGGGGWSISGNIALGGTIGQPDAGYMSAGNVEMFGGFWYGAAFLPQGDCDTDEDDHDGLTDGAGSQCPVDLDADGFVTGIDFDLFVQAFEAGDFASDYDQDGFVTGVDFDLFVQEFEAGC